MSDLSRAPRSISVTEGRRLPNGNSETPAFLKMADFAMILEASLLILERTSLNVNEGCW